MYEKCHGCDGDITDYNVWYTCDRDGFVAYHALCVPSSSLVCQVHEGE